MRPRAYGCFGIGWAAGLLALGCAPCLAMEIREYQPERHDRFTGAPAGHAWNETAWFDSRQYSGVGWAATEPVVRQFALVSPVHVVCAAHFLPAIGSTIRFLGQAGNTVERTVAASEVVVNGDVGNTDLALATLSAPISATEGVTPFPYLNLPEEADYQGSALVVFGKTLRAGRGTVSSFGNFSQGSIGKTRVMRFSYRKDSGFPDDGYLVTGDSGSPTFALVGESPALLGIHTAVEETALMRVNLDTFVPAYISDLNSFMAPAGYQMTPAYLSSVELAASVVTEPSRLWQAEAGSCQFDLENVSSADAGNVGLTIQFMEGQEPDSFEAAGWVLEGGGVRTWTFRRADLPSGASASVTAIWEFLPTEPSLMVELRHRSDGGVEKSEIFSLPLAAGYSAWSTGLADPAQDADPDGDGVLNLLEYAFGGDPADPSAVAAGGVISWLRIGEGFPTLHFPFRTDAAERGLSHQIENSESLETGSWREVPADELTVSQSALTPSVPGFSLRRATHASGGERAFYRVRVTLAE